MASWHPRKLGQWFQAPRSEHKVEPLHQERVHLDPLGEGQLAQLVMDGRRKVDGLRDRRRRPARWGLVAGLRWLLRMLRRRKGRSVDRSNQYRVRSTPCR